VVDLSHVRADFPILERTINGKPLVYLDSAATSQKPRAVLDVIDEYYERNNANVHRGIHELSRRATVAYEDARTKVAQWINAPDTDELVWTRGTTEAINLITIGWGLDNVGEGDEILISTMEHHSNIVPWQMLAAERGIEIRWIQLTDDGRLDLTDLDRLLDGAKVLSFTAMSNVLGTIPPTARLVRAAHEAGAIAIVDACQFVPHNPTDFQAWDADFVAFSSHKMCGPSGVGALWGRMELLESIPPYIGGGNMIADVRLDGFTAAPVPAKSGST